MSSITVFFLVCLGLFALTSWHPFALNLPVLTSAQQCINKGYSGACYYTSLAELTVNVCRNLACAKKVRGRRVRYIKRLTGPPENGTNCGLSKICINKRCTLVNRNQMPKYFGLTTQRMCRDA